MTACGGRGAVEREPAAVGARRAAAPRCGQCARTSPCAHARHMARRLALLALLACAAAVALRRPRPLTDSEDYSYSDSADLWEDFDESPESTPPPRRHPNPPKVKLRTQGPKVNVTVKNKSDDKKVIKTTNINIESHTNFIVTKPPPTKRPQNYVLVHSSEQVIVASTEKPVKSRRPSTTRRPTTRRPPSTLRPAPRPQRAPNRSTRRPPKITKSTTTCAPNNSGWLSSFFNKKVTKNPKKPARTGFFTTLYDWIVVPTKSWFSGGWFFSTPARPKAPITTTTTEMPTTTEPNWFHALLASEDMETEYLPNDASTSTNKRSSKKPLKKNYKGYQLLRTYPDVQWKVNELLELQEDAQGSGLMWWTVPSLNGSTDLLVPPDLLADVKDHLKSVKIDFDVVIWDLQKAIMYENPRMSKKQRLELEQIRGHPMTWRRYHRYADILRYLEYLQHSHSDFVELVPLGRSSEGLPLVAVKISLPSNDTVAEEKLSKGDKKKWKLRSRMKPAVWVDGGMHAREWIAPAVATWMINTLVEGETGRGPEMDLLNQADFYIMPVVNPDGYEHSHTHDRMWKKTRSRSPDHYDDYYVGWFPWNWGQTECVGVDPDRNWDFHWGEQDSSQDACADNYAGPHPFSEPETRAVSEFLADHRGLIKVFLSLHAYSQSWLVPSSHGNTLYYPDDGILLEMGKLATTALTDMFGTKYQVGTAANIRQPASGMSHDWAKARAGIKFAYHVDLRDSYGPYGFLLPGSQIVSTAKETWQAVKAIVDNLSSV